MKVDVQIEENCPRTISWESILAQNFSCKKLSNQKPTATTVRNARRTTLRWMRGEIKELPFIKLTLYLSLSFRNLSLDKLSRVFRVAGFHFSAALKALALGNLFKRFRLDITFAGEVYYLGIKMKKIWQSSYSFHYPQRQNGRAHVMANQTSLNKLPNARVLEPFEMDIISKPPILLSSQPIELKLI